MLAKGELSEEVNMLKNAKGKDLIVYGGSEFVASLIGEGLIDEYHFFINPVMLGEGMMIFNRLKNMQKLRLIKSTGYECGITVLHYELI